jgi:hypothetical protein
VFEATIEMPVTQLDLLAYHNRRRATVGVVSVMSVRMPLKIGDFVRVMAMRRLY